MRPAVPKLLTSPVHASTHIVIQILLRGHPNPLGSTMFHVRGG